MITQLHSSAWTALEPVFGYRHFQVIEVRRGESEWTVELAATLDASQKITLPARVLLRREGWSPGWLQLVTD